MEKYIVSIDQGTSSCRAILVNMQGQIVDIAQQEFAQHFPSADWVEHDPTEILETQMKMFDQVVSKNVSDTSQVIGIGITNQRETTVVWKKTTGKPVYNAIVWQDKRTSNFCKSLKEGDFGAYVYENTGLPIDPYFSGTKVKWILENIDESIDKSELLFGTIDTWLIWNMTQGKSHVTDHTNASRTLLYNIKSKDWDQKILDEFSIPKSVLPSIQNSASHFGSYSYKGVDIPITGVAGDQQAALFGQACFDHGSAKNTYGTGCFMLMNVGDQYISSKNGLLTTMCCDEKGEPTYALEGSIFVAGAAIQWLRDGLKIIEDSAETEQMAESVKDNHSIMFVPSLAGLGAPYWNMDSRGMILGLTRSTTQADIAKATLDAIAYRTKDVLEAMEQDSNIQLNSLRVDGGACKNNYLMQFQADVLDTEVQVPEIIESTAMGAAYLAGIQLGIWDADIIKANRKVQKTYIPSKDSEEIANLYAKWKNAVERSLDWAE